MRLLVSDREAIIRNAVKHAFSKRQSAVAAMENAVARATLDRAMSAFEPRFVTLIEKAPKAFFPTVMDVSARFASTYRSLSLGGSLRVPYGMKNGCILVTDALDPLTDQFRAFEVAEDALKRESGAFKKSVAALVETHRTDTSLFEAWPAGKQFMPVPTQRVTPNLPATTMSEIDKVLAEAEAA